LRRTIREILNGQEYKVPATIDDMGTLDHIKDLAKAWKDSLGGNKPMAGTKRKSSEPEKAVKKTTKKAASAPKDKKRNLKAKGKK